MDCSYRARAGLRNQKRYTISRPNAYGDPGCISHNRIGLLNADPLRLITRLNGAHRGSMHLRDLEELFWPITDRLREAFVIGPNRFLIIPDRPPEV